MSYDQYFDQGFEADLARSLDFTLAFDQSESTPDFYRDLLSSPVPFESADSNDSMSSLASRASFNAYAVPFVPQPDRSDDNLVSEMLNLVADSELVCAFCHSPYRVSSQRAVVCPGEAELGLCPDCNRMIITEAAASKQPMPHVLHNYVSFRDSPQLAALNNSVDDLRPLDLLNSFESVLQSDRSFLERIRMFHRGSESALGENRGYSISAVGRSRLQLDSDAELSVCPSQCGWIGLRADLHESECVNRLLPCKFAKFGCLHCVPAHKMSLHLLDACQHHLSLASACVTELSTILSQMNTHRRRPIGLHPIKVPDISESELTAILSKILMEHGKATIGKLGSLLQSYSGNHTLSTHIKDKYGGLKRFCERYSHLFLINQDHPFNPTVALV